MRRFELVEGSSSKFWQIEQQGTKLVIQWGKIGTAGQSQEKDFPSDAKAQAELDKLVKEKTKKGYAEVGAPAADASAPAPKPRAPKVKEEEPAVATPAVTAQPTTVAPSVEPVIVEPSAPVEIDWNDFEEDDRKEFVVHRHGRLRPNEQQRNADPWSSVQQAWAKWRNVLPFDQWKIAAEFVPAAREAYEWLEAKSPGVLSPMAAAMVVELTDISLDPKDYPVIRAVAEASVKKHGLGWLIDTVLASTRVHLEHHVDPPTMTFHAEPESIGPYAHGPWMPRQLAYIAQAMSDEQYAELISTVESRWNSLSYFQKVRVLDMIPSHSKLADALAEEWIACSGMVEGYVKPAYGNEGVAPELRYAYSKPMLAKIAKKAVNRGYSNSCLFSHLWTQLDLSGANVLAMLRVHCDAVDWAHGIVAGLEVASRVRSVETGALMVSQLTAKKEAAQYAADWSLKNPALSAAALADAVAGAGAIGDRASVLLIEIDRKHPGLLDKIEMRPAARSALIKLRAKMAVKPDASADELPSVLVSPPWLSGKKAATLPVVPNVALAPYADKIHEDPDGLMEQARLDYKEGQESLMTFEDASQNLGTRWSGKYVSGTLVNLKTADLKKAFAQWPPEAWGEGRNVLTPLLVLGEEAIAGYPRIANGNSAMFAACLKHIVESPKLAGFYSYARTLKGARRMAEMWMLHFPKAAAVGLIPIAVGNHTQARDHADMAIRFLVSRGHGQVVREAAAMYGKDVVAALNTALDADPRDRVPAKMPKIGDWCDPDKLPRPLLKGREKSLPNSAVKALVTMLSISTPDSPYVGIEDVVAVCDRASLEDFSWSLFNQWQMGGAPSKENWAMQQLGILGQDEVARKLTPLIRVWPGESLQARAVSGLDVLARIGTDLALMHLNGVAQKIKFKGLQEKAREKMDEVAQNRGLSADELADRLVPDLDLDPDGSRTLDFGSRQFRVSFDEALKPVVVDGNGKTLPDLPKPNKSDDAAKAKEAEGIWKTLKKDVKAIAHNQITRLELAMCSQRRWEVDSFRALFLEHPLLIHLVRRLIWGVYSEDGTRTGAFRVAEDSSLADMQDSSFTLSDGSYVGVVHPLELSESDKAAFGQILGDYNILQPFPQIARDTYAPMDDESKGCSIKRRAGHFVPLGKLLGLTEKGWRKGQPQDAGWIWEMAKTLPGGVIAEISLRTGIGADMQMNDVKQQIGEVSIWRKDKPELTLGELSPVVFSELVRDIVQLGSAT